MDIPCDCTLLCWLTNDLSSKENNVIGKAPQSVDGYNYSTNYFSIPCSINPFISFRDSNCLGLSGAVADEEVDDELSDPWLPPKDLSSGPMLSRSPGRLVLSPASSESASVMLPLLFRPGVSMT